MSLPFLLEIGVEEVPDSMIPGALTNLKDLFEQQVGTQRLVGTSDIKLDGTPRRLVLRANLPESQSEVLILGPQRSIAFKDGKPTAAATGFAKKMQVDFSLLVFEQTPKGECLAYKSSGASTLGILSEILPVLIPSIFFPKTMYWRQWDKTSLFAPIRFVRPIRWIVALLGDKVVPFELAGVRSGSVSGGHRILGKSEISVTHENYERSLQDNFVLLSASARREKIRTEIAALHAHPRPDQSLEDTLVYLTEYPTAILGSFDQQFLALPKEVLIMVMKHHQKNFSVEDGKGNLAPHFIAVMNTSADPEGLVRRGNERVLRARFNDARFFWDTDQRKSLAERLPDLANVTFQAKLGSYLAKTDRVKDLVREFGGDNDAIRAAELCKCDLTTELVKEFTELQGVIGGLYARAQGEPEAVAQAIYDHYKPVSMEDSIPSTLAGQLVSLADKVDTLRSCFSIGMMPTGSRDPFALRRAAQGAVRIIVEGKHDLSLLGTCRDTKLFDFVLDRAFYYFREIRGFKYDEVNAVLLADCDDLVDAEKRLIALQAVRPTENFEPLAASFKRIQNILKQAQFAEKAPIETALLEPGPERDLHAEFQRVRRESAGRDYHYALQAIASLRPAVDLFFDKVLVNATDPKVRQNRLALLHAILTESSTIADFSEIVTNS